MKLSFNILTATIAALLVITLPGCRKTLLEYNPRVNMCSLELDMDFNLKENLYDGESVTERGATVGAASNGLQGKIRYIIKAYPVVEGIRSLNHSGEFVFTKDLQQGYDHCVSIILQQGEYELFVWCDLLEDGKEPIYDASEFKDITLISNNTGNNWYKETFSGSGKVSLSYDRLHEDRVNRLQVHMERPMARYEFVTTDIIEFIASEKSRRKVEKVDLSEYSVVVKYVGFVPDTYNILSDKPVDSAAGLSYNSFFDMLGENIAIVGMDCIFVDDEENAVNLRIGVYDPGGTQVALTQNIKVKLMRGCCTQLSGTFLKENSEGGIDIDTNYDGDHTVIIKN